MEESKKIKYKRVGVNIILGVSEVGDKKEFEAVPYVAEIYEEDNGLTSTSFGFASSEKEKDKIYVVRDKTYATVDANKLGSALSGLDAWHSSLKATAIDSVVNELSKDKSKDEITQLMTQSIGHIKSSNLYGHKYFAHKDFETDDATIDIDADGEKLIAKEIKRIENMLNDSSSSSSGTFSRSKIDAYSFTKHMMLVGEAGSGKTHSLSSFIYDAKSSGSIDNYVELNGHEGIEAFDMLGSQVPNSDRTLTWVDGPVSEAFRSASKGKKTVLFVDEILRIPQRELSILVGSLTPRADGLFHLNTNRANGELDSDGIGSVEEIVVDPQFLWVVAASNVGSDFAVDDMDAAFKDRFRTFRVDSAKEIIQHILKSAETDGHIDSRESKALMSIWENYQDIKKAGNLQKTFSARHVSEIIQMKKVKDYEIYDSLNDLRYTVLSVNSTGIINAAENDVWTKLIEIFE